MEGMVKLVAYVIMGLGFVYLFGAASSLLIEYIRHKKRDIVQERQSTHHVEKMLTAKNDLDRKRREGGKYSDTRIDELLALNKTDEAKQLVNEKLRNAHEQSNETLIRLYKQYQDRLG